MRSQSRAWVAGAGLVLAAACTGGSHAPAARPPLGSTTTTPPVTSVASSGGRVLDMTWLSPQKGWALVAKPCGAGNCRRLLSTEDGGSTWTPQAFGRVEPADVAGCEQFACVGHLRFASSTVGYLWSNEPGASFVSVDAGRSWRVMSPAWILSLEPAGRVVIRVIAPQGLPGQPEVDRAAVGSTDWTPTNTGTGGSHGATVITAPGAAYLAFSGNPAGGAGDAHTAFVRSTDEGQRWASFADPCGRQAENEEDADSAAAGPGGLFAVICSPRTGEGPPSVRVSTDMGAHFGPARSLPDPASGARQLALPSANDVVVALTGGGQQPSVVWHSGDAGRTWTRVLTAPPAVEQGGIPSPWLGFEDEKIGRVSFATDALWTSRDAGRTWQMSTLP